jgi:uncharacterized membrane protein
MPFCKSCGQEIGTAAFCPKCGTNQAPAAPMASVPAAPPAEGLAENVAGFLCYLGVWVTGIIFLLIDKRPWVRFHAAQSIVVFAGLHLIHFALRFLVHPMGGLIFVGLAGMLHVVFWLAGLILWIVLMIEAFQHKTFRVPIAADIADSIAK